MCNDKINKKVDLDEHGCCGSRFVKVHKPWHVCMFLMSFHQPGAGAFWNACCCHDDDKAGCVYGNFIYSFVQQALSICLIGWIQSMAFGVGIYRKTSKS